MAITPQTDWVLPASIPFEELKGRDLEECVYWLLDAMGARDLEWRIGGSGEGAADQGRDLEAHFYAPTADGEMENQKWWIECKGRKGTLETEAVKNSVTNSLAVENLNYLVVVTNTTFTNPTRDWVKEWQKKNALPKVRLWDRSHLERHLSKHPAVVLRLFAQALSPQGRLQAIESRFWNKFEYSNPSTLAEIWKKREELDLNPLAIFALVTNEFAHGNIIHRPWATTLDDAGVVQVLAMSFLNVTYLVMRGMQSGAEQRPMTRALVYLLLVALDRFSAEAVTAIMTRYLNRDQNDPFPPEVQELLLMPIMDQLMSEMQDVCTSDCRRLMSSRRHALTEESDEVDNYWLRLEPDGITEPEQRQFLRIESTKESCKVGFPVDEDNGCPLFRIEPTISNTGELLAIVKRVVAFRKAQAAAKRKEEEERAAALKNRIKAEP